MSERYGNVKATTIKRDIDRVRVAVRAHDAEATEAAWDKLERWLGVFPAQDVLARIEALEAALAKADELWGVIDTPDQSDGREGNYHYDWQRVDNALTAYRQARDATR